MVLCLALFGFLCPLGGAFRQLPWPGANEDLDGRFWRMVSGLIKLASTSKFDGLVLLVNVMVCFPMLVLISNMSLVHLGALHTEYLAVLQAF